jgi:hypothetical protein
MISLLEAAEFNGQPISQQQIHTLQTQAQALLDQAQAAGS